MANGYTIDRQQIRRMVRDINKEFAKHPVRVPVAPHQASGWPGQAASAYGHPMTTVQNFHAPVVTGDHAQVAWANEGGVTQSQHMVNEMPPRYQHLAQVITSLLDQLPGLPLSDDDINEARDHAETVLSEVGNAAPDQARIRKAVTMIKGLVAPVMLGASAGVTTEVSDKVQHIIEALVHAFPS